MFQILVETVYKPVFFCFEQKIEPYKCKIKKRDDFLTSLTSKSRWFFAPWQWSYNYNSILKFSCPTIYGMCICTNLFLSFSIHLFSSQSLICFCDCKLPWIGFSMHFISFFASTNKLFFGMSLCWVPNSSKPHSSLDFSKSLLADFSRFLKLHVSL